MMTETIAQLTGKVKFEVDYRPLVSVQKRLEGLMGTIKQFTAATSKRFNIKVALDARSLRAQMEKAANTKIAFKNFTVDDAALAATSKKICEKLDNTPIRLKNVRVDVADLVTQKKFIRTLLGQMSLTAPIKIDGLAAEKKIKSWINGIESRLGIRLKIHVDEQKVIRDIRQAIRRAGQSAELKLRTDPNMKLRVNLDKAYLEAQIREVLRKDYTIRIRPEGGGPRPTPAPGDHRRVAGAAGFGAGAGAGLMGFARGAIPGLGAAFAIVQVNRINQELTASQTALEAVSGSAEGYASNMKFLEKITAEQGRNMRDVAPQFTSVLASAKASIGNEGTQRLFQGLLKYGTVMGLDGEAMKGSMRAISQMFSKDKIQAEEAQGQLAERLPAAMQLLAQANGTDVPGLREQMQKGALDPKKVLPEMARIMEDLAEANGAYAKALASTRVAQGRMNREFEKSIQIFSKGGFDKGMGGFFNNMADNMRKAEPLVYALGAAFDVLIVSVNAFVSLIGDLGKYWPDLAKGLGMTSGELAILASTVALLMLPFGSFIAMVSGLVLVLQDLSTFAQGGNSVFGNWLKDTPVAQEAFDGLAKSAGEFWNNLKLALGVTGDLEKALKELNFSNMMISTMQELKSILDTFNSVVNRLVDAGVFAQMETQGEGDNLASNVKKNFKVMQALAMGKDWTDEQLSRKADDLVLNQLPPNVVQNQGQSLTADNWKAAVEDILSRQQEVNVALTLQVEAGAMGPDFPAQMVEPIKKIAQQAFTEVVANARSQQKETRR